MTIGATEGKEPDAIMDGDLISAATAHELIQGVIDDPCEFLVVVLLGQLPQSLDRGRVLRHAACLLAVDLRRTRHCDRALAV